MLTNTALDNFTSAISYRYHEVTIDETTYERFDADLYRAGNALKREIRDNLLNLDTQNQLIYLREIISGFKKWKPKLLPVNSDITFRLKALEEGVKEAKEPQSTLETFAKEIEVLKVLQSFREKIYSLPRGQTVGSFEPPMNETEWNWYLQETISCTLINGWETALEFLRARTIDSELVEKLHWDWTISEFIGFNSKNTNVQSTTSTSAPTETVPAISVPPFQWRGTGAELAALFVELDAKGYIQLPGPSNFDRTPWEKICRAILSLFSLSTQRKDSKGEPWYNFRTYFVSRAENERTGELEYHKLHESRSKFKHILPKTPGLNDPK